MGQLQAGGNFESQNIDFTLILNTWNLRDHFWCGS